MDCSNIITEPNYRHLVRKNEASNFWLIVSQHETFGHQRFISGISQDLLDSRPVTDMALGLHCNVKLYRDCLISNRPNCISKMASFILGRCQFLGITSNIYSFIVL